MSTARQSTPRAAVPASWVRRRPWNRPNLQRGEPARQQRAPRRTASCIMSSRPPLSTRSFALSPDLVRNARHIGHTSPDASLPKTPRPSPPAGVIGRGPPARRCARRCRRLHDKRIRSKARRGFVAACQPFVDIRPDVAKHALLRPSPDVLFCGPLALDFLYTTCLACGPPPFLQRPSIETPWGVNSTRIHSDHHLALLCGLVDGIAFAPSNHTCTYFQCCV